jgi:hypothetical protein
MAPNQLVSPARIDFGVRPVSLESECALALLGTDWTRSGILSPTLARHGA